MKIEGKTIPAPQNIRRREKFILDNKEKLPVNYVHAELMKIAMVRAENRLTHWTKEEALNAKIAQTSKDLGFKEVPKKVDTANRFRDWFKPKEGKRSQRGN